MKSLLLILRSVIEQTREAVATLVGTIRYTLESPWNFRAIGEHMFLVGNRSLVFVLLTLGFLGAITSLQAGFQALRIIGDTTIIGQQLLPLLVRQLGPTLVGLMVATRVGTGIAAEIGSMVVTEQVDALRMCNAPPLDYLVKPRFLACLVMLPVLVVFGVMAAFLSAMGVAALVFHTPPRVFANLDFVSLIDVGEGLVKAVAFGAAIPVIAGAAGLAARGGSEGVGEATTRAVVSASLAVIVLDFVIGGLAFLVRT
jgi:phospholipid/cholesterol/gamma-HCH transport system permease protein